jgi:hypothetical protein
MYVPALLTNASIRPCLVSTCLNAETIEVSSSMSSWMASILDFVDGTSD